MYDPRLYARDATIVPSLASDLSTSLTFTSYTNTVPWTPTYRSQAKEVDTSNTDCFSLFTVMDLVLLELLELRPSSPLPPISPFSRTRKNAMSPWLLKERGVHCRHRIEQNLQHFFVSGVA
ncbi:hypothetical protein E2C01_003647 [Portunus trituberculatus]|uniref:Uncharacterized protein n=1 Tax=Portunus trituberculatus TaxID=210409 RepID=A0A5B7CRT0_PORTR|nr:hypothetical protein [Portunus trituberculatus]